MLICSKPKRITYWNFQTHIRYRNNSITSPTGMAFSYEAGKLLCIFYFSSSQNVYKTRPNNFGCFWFKFLLFLFVLIVIASFYFLTKFGIFVYNDKDFVLLETQPVPPTYYYWWWWVLSGGGCGWSCYYCYLWWWWCFASFMYSLIFSFLF